MRYLTLLAAVLMMPILLGSSCPTYEPPPPPTLSSPTLLKPQLKPIQVATRYREAVVVQWNPPVNDSLPVKWYRLLRKAGADTVFTIASPLIPDSIREYPDITNSFPTAGTTTIQYRAFAIDSLGRSGDTSTAAMIILTNQPELDTVIAMSMCANWSLSLIQGSVQTWARIWNSSRSVDWVSDTTEDFVGADAVWRFGACGPAHLRPLSKGTWWVALYLEANVYEYSLTVEEIHVP